MVNVAGLRPKLTYQQLTAQLSARRPMVLRVISAVALAIPAILITIWGGWIFSLAVSLCGAVMAYEWNRIAYRERADPGFALHLGGLAAVAVLAGSGEAQLALGAIGIVTVLGFFLARREGLDPLWLCLGGLYVLLPVMALIWLREAAVEPAAVVLWLFSVVWATDIAALAVGRAIGGPRLAPTVSPAKTWAGLAGGVVGAALVGFLGGWLIAHEAMLGLGLWGALLAVLGQLGDLTESAFKRRFGVKDSSGFIPGQGGLLDRVDGLIFATLSVAILALFRGGDVLFLSVQP